MRIFLATAILSGILFSPAVTVAEENQSAEPGRYRFVEVENGYLRFDRVTGNISRCQEEAGIMACRMGPDERAAYEKAMDKLEDRISELEDRLAAIEAGKRAPLGPESKDTEADPADELDQAMDFMERAMRRFYSVIEDLKKEYEGRDG